MAQVSIGKLLPNLKITLGNDATGIIESEFLEGDDLSDGEIKDSNSNTEIVRSWMESLQNPKIYKNKTGGFTTGLDLMSEENAEMLDKRAERFGLEKEELSSAPNISSLYESMNITIDNRNSAKMKNLRLEALHMRGINELSTNEIFQYFIDYGPASVEWINDFSCNVVWLDEISCARALLGVSKPLDQSKVIDAEKTTQPDSDEITKLVQTQESITPGIDSQNEVKMEVEDESQSKSNSSEAPVNIPVPPGYWRLGVPHAKAKAILLRFATKDDKKLPGAEKRSDYYKKYGNPNYGGLKGLISGSRKRKMQAATNKRSVERSSSENNAIQSSTLSDHDEDFDTFKPKVVKPKPPPRMRMYADEEELKIKKMREKNVVRKKQSVYSRLGTKYTKDELCQLGTYPRAQERNTFNEDDDFFLLDDRRSVSRNIPSYNKRNWDRHDLTDLRTKIKKLKNDSSKKHRSPLCVEDSDSESEEN